MDEFTLILQPLIEALAGKYGSVAQVMSAVVMAIGTLRIFFKPIMEAIEKIVANTETKSDDAKLEQVKKSLAFRAFVFFMDFALSIKVPTLVKAAAKKDELPKA